jgi:hypothetical protein
MRTTGTVFLLLTTVAVTTIVVSLQEKPVTTAPTGTSQVAPKRVPPKQVAPKPATKKLPAFASAAELEQFLRGIATERSSRQRSLSPMTMAAPSPVASADANARAVVAEGAESVTNVQHAGVDEGGIVKVHGDHLVVLRRGRIFTIAIADRELRPVSHVDAFGPGMDPGGTWYDEMLIAGDTVIVIGYSYQRGGTEVGLFDIDRFGKLRYRSTYHLRSNDYYSSRNYASRLIGTKLIFYTPLWLHPSTDDPLRSLPAIRKWHTGAAPGEFRSIIAAANIYKSSPSLSVSEDVMLHTVTTCDLARADLECHATAVAGPSGRVFYVSPESVYVWVSDWSRRHHSRSRSMVYQLPLDGSAPSALQVSGSPVDQFSFFESNDGHLNVLVRAEAAGDGMWRAEVADGEVALLRVPRDMFSDGSMAASASDYRQLPTPRGYTFQNRFVGDYVLYGTGNGWGPVPTNDKREVYAARWNKNFGATLRLPHGVDRIEALGSHAVVVGASGPDLYFSAIYLGEQPAVAGQYIRQNATQGETRSHGFFYKPEEPNTGMLGLPITRAERPGYRQLFEGSASIMFLRNESLRFSEIGELASQPEGFVDDRCRASCVDWYGNARPLFIGGRVFALLGYEIVEGKLTSGRIEETRRISFSPVRTPR